MDSAACHRLRCLRGRPVRTRGPSFTGAKITHLGLLPQGAPERERRAVRMVGQMDAEGFGPCSNEGECEAVCPKLIPFHIAKMVREYARAVW